MENQNHPVNDMLSNTIQKIREAIDANTVVGKPITAGNVTLVPVSRLSFGFGSGGSEFGKADEGGIRSYGGGGGAGAKVTPLCFLVVSGDNVRVLPIDPPVENTMDRVVELVPNIADKIGSLLEKRKKPDAPETVSE